MTNGYGDVGPSGWSSEVQVHADTIFSVAAAAMTGNIIATPERYHQGSPGRNLVDDIVTAVQNAGRDAENFADLNP